MTIKNWSTDGVGRLQSRNGHANVTTAGAGAVHSLRRWKNARYAGSGGALYRNGASIATGFDGSKLGLAAHSGRMWVMNRSKQGKDDGTNFYNWTPAAPASAPTMAAGSVTTVAVTSFDNTETWTVLSPDGSSSAGTFTSSAVLAEALEITAAEAGNYTATRVFAAPVNLSIGGQQRQEDIFRIHMLTSDPAAIDSITIAVDVNAGDFKTDYFSITIAGSELKAWTWEKIRRKRARNTVTVENPQYVRLLEQARSLREAGDDIGADAIEAEARSLAPSSSYDESGFERTGSTALKDWSTAKAIRISIACNASCVVRLDQADFEGGAGGSLNGTFQYWVTFGTAEGEESNPSPGSAEISVSGASVAVTIPGTTDPQNTIAFVYRISNLIRTPLLVGTSTPGATFTDTSTDQAAQVLGKPLRYDRDSAPLARLLVEYQGRLIALGSTAKPGRMWWTPVGEPTTFRGSENSDAEGGDWTDVGDAEEEILGATVHGNQLWIYKERGIYRLVGDPDENEPERMTETYAPSGLWAVAEGGDVDYFASAAGVFLFNGDQVRVLSDAVQPVFRDLHRIGAIPLDAGAAGKIACGFGNDLLYVSYPEAGNAVNTTTLIYDPRKGEWFQDSRSFTVFHAEGPKRELTAGLASGAVVGIGDGLTDAGSAFFAEWQSGYVDMGLPENDKVIEDLSIEYLSPAALTVKIYTEDGTETTLGTLPIAAARTVKAFRLGTAGKGLRSRRFAVRIEGDLSARAEIFRTRLHWYPEVRWALSFDSNLIDGGTEFAKRLHRLQLDLESTAAVNLAIDGEAGELFTATIAGTGRRVLELPLDASNIVTRKYRVRLWADAVFKLHDMSVQVTAVPIFIKASEAWQTQEVIL